MRVRLKEEDALIQDGFFSASSRAIKHEFG
jgi:hypothetical protein